MSVTMVKPHRLRYADEGGGQADYSSGQYQVVRLMQQLLEEEPQISLEGKGRGSRYVYRR